MIDAGYPGCSAAALDLCPSVKQFVDDYFGYQYDFRWWCVLILMGFITLFLLSAAIALKKVNHVKR